MQQSKMNHASKRTEMSEDIPFDRIIAFLDGRSEERHIILPMSSVFVRLPIALSISRQKRPKRVPTSGLSLLIHFPQYLCRHTIQCQSHKMDFHSPQIKCLNRCNHERHLENGRQYTIFHASTTESYSFLDTLKALASTVCNILK